MPCLCHQFQVPCTDVHLMMLTFGRNVACCIHNKQYFSGTSSIYHTVVNKFIWNVLVKVGHSK